MGLQHQAGGGVYRRMGFQYLVDLPQFDAEATDLDLGVLPPQEVDNTLAIPIPQVAGVVQPLPGLRVHDKPGCGLFRIAPIAQGQTAARDMQPARHVQRALRAVVLQHMPGLVAQRQTVGDGGPRRVDVGNRVIDRPDRRFRGPAQTDQPCLGGRPLQSRRQA